jgi:hypothetical protein
MPFSFQIFLLYAAFSLFLLMPLLIFLYADVFTPPPCRPPRRLRQPDYADFSMLPSAFLTPIFSFRHAHSLPAISFHCRHYAFSFHDAASIRRAMAP